MAKWGEGDPRWIVEERADATNVNNWHWTEKNATGWSKEKLKELLVGLVVEDDSFNCEVTDLTTLEGEATANNRKAKLIFFYEWDIKGEWKGNLKASKTTYKGNFDIPNLSDENGADEIHVNFSAKSSEDEAYCVKEFMRIKGREKIREQVTKYIEHLTKEFTQGMILPAKNGSSTNENKTSPQKPPTNAAKQEINRPILSAVKDQGIGVKIICKKITDDIEFKCRASELYRALTDQQMVCAFTQSPCQVEALKGGRFSLLGDVITGEFTELVTDSKLEMRWRTKSWPPEHYSQVTLTLTEKEDCTKLKLVQTGVPETDFDRTRDGWHRYYWQAIKSTFGFGANLF